MRILKVIMILGITAAAIKSCDIDVPFVTRKALEVSQNETKEARQAAGMNHAGAQGRCEVINYKIQSL
ncbi:MAG: hypothetical protein Q4F39_07310 [Bacteroidia bacterium]|nr:hypothetical protein [Bacteroidia bacterium]